MQQRIPDGMRFARKHTSPDIEACRARFCRLFDMILCPAKSTKIKGLHTWRKPLILLHLQSCRSGGIRIIPHPSIA